MRMDRRRSGRAGQRWPRPTTLRGPRHLHDAPFEPRPAAAPAARPGPARLRLRQARRFSPSCSPCSARPRRARWPIVLTVGALAVALLGMGTAGKSLEQITRDWKLQLDGAVRRRWGQRGEVFRLALYLLTVKNYKPMGPAGQRPGSSRLPFVEIVARCARRRPHRVPLQHPS